MPLRNYTTNSKQVKIKGLPISTDNEMQRQLMSTGIRQPMDVVPQFSLATFLIGFCKSDDPGNEMHECEREGIRKGGMDRQMLV